VKLKLPIPSFVQDLVPLHSITVQSQKEVQKVLVLVVALPILKQELIVKSVGTKFQKKEWQNTGK